MSLSGFPLLTRQLAHSLDRLQAGEVMPVKSLGSASNIWAFDGPGRESRGNNYAAGLALAEVHVLARQRGKFDLASEYPDGARGNGSVSIRLWPRGKKARESQKIAVAWKAKERRHAHQYHSNSNTCRNEESLCLVQT